MAWFPLVNIHPWTARGALEEVRRGGGSKSKVTGRRTIAYNVVPPQPWHEAHPQPTAERTRIDTVDKRHGQLLSVLETTRAEV